VGGRPLIEHWDGRAWRIVPSPDTGGGYLNSVSAVSTRDIWAVGNVRGEPLTEQWDGARWTIVPNPRGPDRPPTPGYDSRSLWGVVAIAPRDVWAVGTVHDGELPLIEHWNMITLGSLILMFSSRIRRPLYVVSSFGDMPYVEMHRR